MVIFHCFRLRAKRFLLTNQILCCCFFPRYYYIEKSRYPVSRPFHWKIVFKNLWIAIKRSDARIRRLVHQMKIDANDHFMMERDIRGSSTPYHFDIIFGWRHPLSPTQIAVWFGIPMKRSQRWKQMKKKWNLFRCLVTDYYLLQYYSIEFID